MFCYFCESLFGKSFNLFRAFFHSPGITQLRDEKVKAANKPKSKSDSIAKMRKAEKQANKKHADTFGGFVEDDYDDFAVDYEDRFM